MITLAALGRDGDRHNFPSWIVVLICLVCTSILEPGRAHGQFLRDTTRVSDQEFLRLLQQSDQLNAEQKARARKTRNPRVLARLAEDEDPGVRFYVAFNPWTSSETLTPLSADPSPTIRWGVARNSRFLFDLDPGLVRNLDDATGSGFSEIGRAFGRQGIHLTSSAQLETLDPGKRWVITDRYQDFEIKRLRTGLKVYNKQTSDLVLAALAEDFAEVVRVGLASNPNAPDIVLRTLHEDISPTVRRHVALNENTDPLTLEILSKDPEHPVRLAVAGNPFAPAHVLAEFSVDRDEAIRVKVSTNPGCSPALLLGMIFDTSVDVRKGIAAHPSLPAPGLAHLADDTSLEVRLAVVANANTMPDALRRLAFDENDDIKGDARTRLAVVLKDRIASDRER